MKRNLKKLLSAILVFACIIGTLMIPETAFAASSTASLSTSDSYYITSAKYSSQAINMYVNKSSSIKNNTKVNLYKLDKSQTQLFTFKKNSAGNYLMIPKGTSYTVNVSALKAGTSVIAWQNKAANNEYFIVDKTSDGYYTFRMANKPSLYLTATSQSAISLKTKASDNSQKFKLTKYPVNVAVKSVSLNKTAASVYAGSSVTLTAAVAPSNATNKGVTWSTSNAKVAAVSSSGVVTGKAVGTAKITVTTKDGKKTAICTVTVKKALTYTQKVNNFLADSRWKPGNKWLGTQTGYLVKDRSWGCCAYATDFVKYVYNVNFYTDTKYKTKYTSVSSIKTGDIIYTNKNKSTQHWMVILKRSGNKIEVAEGNIPVNGIGRIRKATYTISGKNICKGSTVYKVFSEGYHFKAK